MRRYFPFSEVKADFTELRKMSVELRKDHEYESAKKFENLGLPYFNFHFDRWKGCVLKLDDEDKKYIKDAKLLPRDTIYVTYRGHVLSCYFDNGCALSNNLRFLRQESKTDILQFSDTVHGETAFEFILERSQKPEPFSFKKFVDLFCLDWSNWENSLSSERNLHLPTDYLFGGVK